MITCKKCDETKDTELFPLYKTRSGEMRPRATCLDCFRKVSRDWQIKSRYQLTPEEYDSLISQGCEVCGSYKNLHIDHDHDCCNGKRTCGKCIRGVLCAVHNWAEGVFKTSEELHNMSVYILKNTNVLGDILS